MTRHLHAVPGPSPREPTEAPAEQAAPTEAAPDAHECPAISARQQANWDAMDAAFAAAPTERAKDDLLRTMYYDADGALRFRSAELRGLE